MLTEVPFTYNQDLLEMQSCRVWVSSSRLTPNSPAFHVHSEALLVSVNVFVLSYLALHVGGVY